MPEFAGKQNESVTGFLCACFSRHSKAAPGLSMYMYGALKQNMGIISGQSLPAADAVLPYLLASQVRHRSHSGRSRSSRFASRNADSKLELACRSGSNRAPVSTSELSGSQQ